MDQSDAMKILKGYAAPEADVQHMLQVALEQTRTWESVKARLSRNLRGRINWDTHIFRIVPLTSFLRLVLDHTCLFMRPDAWEDPYENFWLRHLFVDPNGQRISFDSIAKGFYAQCWSMNPDSAALWRTATADPAMSSAVRIESTIEDYCRVLCSGISPAYLSQIEEHLYVGMVNYEKESFFNKLLKEPLTADEERNLIAANKLQDKAVETLLMKREAFSFEEEVRFILDVKDISHMRFFRECDYPEHRKSQLVCLSSNIEDFLHSIEINPWCKPYEADIVQKLIKEFLPECPIWQSNLLWRKS